MPIPRQFLIQRPDAFTSAFHADMHEMPHAKDGQLAARENEFGVLLSIGLFGHLRGAEIAMAVWPDSPQESGQKMARRTLKRLMNQHEILERPNGLGGISFVLTKRGAARLKAYGEFADGYDIQGVQGPTFFHRTLTTAYLVTRQTKGALVMGEYAIAKANHSLGKAAGAVPEAARRLGSGPRERTRH